MAQPVARIRVELDSKPAEDSAQSLGKTLIGAFTPSIDVVSLVEDALKDALVGGFVAAVQAEQQERKLDAALKARGLSTIGVVDRVNQLNFALMQSTGIADDELLALQTKLVALGATSDELEFATRATIGLAEATGRDLLTAGTAVARVLQGNTSALSKIGIESENASDALDRLSELSDIAGENVGGLTGKFELLKQNIGEVFETIGSPAARSEGLSGALTYVNDIVLGIGVGAAGMVDGFVMSRDAINGIDGAILKPLADFANAALGGLPDQVDKIARLGRGALAEAQDLPPEVFRTDDREVAYRERSNEMLQEEIEKADKIRKKDIESLQKFADHGVDLLHKQYADEREAHARREEEMRRHGDEMRRLGELATHAEAQELMLRDGDRARAETEASLAVDREFERDEMIARNREINAQRNAEVMREAAENERRMLAEGAEARAGMAESIMTTSGSMIGSLAGMLGAAAATGQSAGEVFEAIGGMLLSTIGNQLIAMGTAAVAAGLLGTAVPWLMGITGGPGAVVAGGVAIAAGAALTAAGAAVTASVGSSQPRASRTRSTSRRTEADDSSGFVKREGAASNTFMINFNGGVFGGDPRRLGRELADLIRNGSTLTPSRGGA